MPNDRRASSSDLDRARAISQRLRGPAPAAPSPPPNEPKWADFSGLRFELRARSAPASKPSSAAHPAGASLEGARAIARPIELPSVGDVGSSAYDRLLDWCLTALEARDACLVDTQGLVVAARGSMSADAVQDVAARLVVAFAQVERIGSGLAPASLVLELADAWLSGFRVAIDGDHTLFVALVTKDPVGREKRALVEKAFASVTRGF